MRTLRLIRDQGNRWAVATWVLTAVGAVGLVWAMASGLHVPEDPPRTLLPELATLISYGVVGAVLVDRRPDLPFGWILSAAGVAVGVGGIASTVAIDPWQGGDTGLLVRIGASTGALLFLPVAVQGIVNVRFPSVGRDRVRAPGWTGPSRSAPRCRPFVGADDCVLQDRPLFRVGRRRFAIFNGATSPSRPRWANSGRTLHFLADRDEWAALSADERFRPSPHHSDRRWLAIALPSVESVDWDEIAELLDAAYRQVSGRA